MAVVTCPRSGCKTILSSACVFYEGESLLYTGINTNDPLEIVIQKIDTYLQSTIPGIGSDQISFEKQVFQIAHGLVVGDAIRHNGVEWVKAKADTLANSGTVGVVSDVFDTNNFTYQFGGLFTSGTWNNGVSYFLSKTTSGAIVPEQAPYSDGEVREFIGTGTPDGLLLELDLGDLYTDGIVSPPSGGGPTNTVTDYRSSFESDGWVYAGFLLNLIPVITKTKDGSTLTAQSVTDLETDWTNRLSLTYI